MVIKDEVLISVGCPIFPSILIAKYLFTGSLKNRSIDNLETQKKYISMKNSQIFNYLFYAKSKSTWNKILIKKSLSTKLPTEERRTVGKINGTTIANRLQNSFKITCTDHRIIEILGLRPSNRLPVSYYMYDGTNVSYA